MRGLNFRDPLRPAVGAIDVGTTGVRFVLFDRNAVPIDSAYRALPLSTPHPGWVEQDPEILLAATRTVIEDALSRHPNAGTSLAAIGLSNQRETVIAWDRRTANPLHPAIVWQDRRTATRCEALRRRGDAGRIPLRTGLSIDPYFSATKIEWLLENVRGLRDRASRNEVVFGTVDAWLLRRLVGCCAMDVTNASRTLLFDIDTRDWEPNLLGLFGVPRAALPEVRSSLSIFGSIDPDLVPGDVPIAGVLGDQQASLLGQGAIVAGQGQVTWGTGAFLMMCTGQRRAHSRNGLLSTLAAAPPDAAPTYALEGSVFVAGAAIQWLRDVVGLLSDAADSAAMSQVVDSTEGVVFVPALTGLGSPHWDPDARGTIVGITRGTRREHLVRAALEAIAYQTLDIVHAMEADTGEPLSELRVGGGAAINDFLCQFQSDILGIPIIRPRYLETTAQGAAFAAGVSVGLWDSLGKAVGLLQEERRFEPSIREATRDEWIGQWHRAVERAKGWAVGES